MQRLTCCIALLPDPDSLAISGGCAGVDSTVASEDEGDNKLAVAYAQLPNNIETATGKLASYAAISIWSQFAIQNEAGCPDDSDRRRLIVCNRLYDAIR